MRIWHEKLIPLLCRNHLLSCWREGLGCYSIIVNNKNGYKKHPQVKEFENNHLALWLRLYDLRQEMKNRGYHPKPLPEISYFYKVGGVKSWQSLEEQKEILKKKNCGCKIK